MGHNKFIAVPVGEDWHLVNVGNIVKIQSYAKGTKAQLLHYGVGSNDIERT